MSASTNVFSTDESGDDGGVGEPADVNVKTQLLAFWVLQLNEGKKSPLDDSKRRCRLTAGPIILKSTGKNIKLCNVPKRMIPKYMRK